MEKSAVGLTLEPKGYLIPKSKLSVLFFHSPYDMLGWTPLRHDNGIVMYDSLRHRKEFLRRFAWIPNRESVFMEINVYSFQDRWTPYPTRIIKRHRITTSFEDLLNTFLQERNRVKAHAAQNKLLDVNRKMSLILLDLGEHELVDLKKPSVQKTLRDLVENSAAERMYFFILAEDAYKVPSEIIHIFDWQVFLGKDNTRLARELYQGERETLYNEKRELVGVLKEKDADFYIPIHDTIFEESQHKMKTDKVIDIEEDAFQKILDSI